MPSYCAWTGDVQQERIGLVTAEALGQHAGPSRGVDHDTDSHGPGAAVFVREAERDAVLGERRVDQPMLFEHPGAGLLGVAQQDLVEFFAQHLKRLGRGRLARELEVGVSLVRPIGAAKAGPHFSTNPAAAIVSRTPSVRRISLVHGSCDSPMWKRGNRSRSSTTTLRPRWASAVAAVEPPGPPPMTATS